MPAPIRPIGGCRPPEIKVRNPGNPFSTLQDYINIQDQNDAYRACLETETMKSATGLGGRIFNPLLGFFKSAILQALTKVFIEGLVQRIKDFMKQIKDSQELAKGAAN